MSINTQLILAKSFLAIAMFFTCYLVAELIADDMYAAATLSMAMIGLGIWALATDQPRGELHDAAAKAEKEWDEYCQSSYEDWVAQQASQSSMDFLDAHGLEAWMNGYVIDDEPDYSNLSEYEKIGMSQEDFL